MEEDSKSISDLVYVKFSKCFGTIAPHQNERLAIACSLQFLPERPDFTGKNERAALPQSIKGDIDLVHVVDEFSNFFINKTNTLNNFLPGNGIIKK